MSLVYHDNVQDIQFTDIILCNLPQIFPHLQASDASEPQNKNI